MNSYIKSLKDEGYISLRDEYYDNLNSFPSLRKTAGPNAQDPDTIIKEDQTNNDEDDDKTEEVSKTAEKTQQEPNTGKSPPTGNTLTEKPVGSHHEESAAADEPPTGLNINEDSQAPPEQPLPERETQDTQVPPEQPLPERETQVKTPTELENQKATQLNKLTTKETKDKKTIGTKMKVPNIEVKM